MSTWCVYLDGYRHAWSESQLHSGSPHQVSLARYQQPACLPLMTAESFLASAHTPSGSRRVLHQGCTRLDQMSVQPALLSPPVVNSGCLKQAVRVKQAIILSHLPKLYGSGMSCRYTHTEFLLHALGIYFCIWKHPT